MARRSKHIRENFKITQDWVQSYCLPRLTRRDLEVLRFVAENRIVTLPQVAKKFFSGRNPEYLARRRLRILFDLHCVDRFFPFVASGSSPQHVVLGTAGAKVLGLERPRLIHALPASYLHTITLVDVRLILEGLGTSIREKPLGPVIPDLYYPSIKLAVEVDLGTESRGPLTRKLTAYRTISDLAALVFVTTGSQGRVDSVVKMMKGRARFPTVGVRMKDLPEARRWVARTFLR